MARDGISSTLLDLLGRAVPYDLNYTNLKLLGVQHLSFRTDTEPFHLEYCGAITSCWEHGGELSWYYIDYPKPLAPVQYIGKFCDRWLAGIHTPGFEYKYDKSAYMTFDQPYLVMVVSNRWPREMRVDIIRRGVMITRKIRNDRITLDGSLEDVYRAFEYFWDLRRNLGV